MTAMTFDTPRRPAAPRPRTASPVRLTRRGRVTVLLGLVALLVLVAFALGRQTAAAGTSGPGAPGSAPRPTTVVQPGETLWEIARRVAPGADPRSTVARLTELNDLGSTPIVAGQRLTLPR